MYWLRIFSAALVLVSACKREPGAEELYNQAEALLGRGELQAATAVSKQRGELEPGSELWWKWRLLHAEIAAQDNQIKSALELLADPVPFPELEARRHVDRCIAFVTAGDIARAQESVDAAGAAITRATPTNIRLQSEVCRGVILQGQGKRDEADAVFRRVAEEAEGRSPYHRATALANLARTSLHRSRYDVAALYGEQALRAAEESAVKRLIAASAANLATYYNLLGEFDSALPLLGKAASIAQEIGNAYWLQNALAEQGNSHYHLGDYARAAEFYERAYGVAAGMEGGQPQKWAGNRAAALIEARRLEEAEQWNQIALQRAPKDAYYLSNAAEIWRQRGDTDKALALCKEAQSAAGDNPELARGLHAQFASIYQARGDAAAARREFELALRSIEDKQRELSGSTYQIGFLSRLIGYYHGYIAALMVNGDYAAALQVAERSRARVMADRLGRGRKVAVLDAAALARKTGCVLVSYWLAEDSSFVWVVNRAGIHFEKLPGRKRIDEVVHAYRKTVEESLRDPLTSEAGRRFYEVVVQPVARLIEPGSQVVLVPDGSLHQVNLEAAPVPGARPHYWVEDVTIAIAPSLAVLNVGGPFAGTHPALLFGAPETVDPRYPALVNAPAEMASIRGIVGQHAEVREGARATPAAFFASTPQRFSLIHFAAHGESNRQSPLDSAVILSQSERGFKLYARDVIDLPLRAGLVTISGCRSAGARSYSGEGLIGFAWAFLQAGAESVIAGLWEVGDRSTAELMRMMYGELAAGATPAAALHSAKLAMIRKGGTWARAREWAAFQTYIRTLHR